MKEIPKKPEPIKPVEGVDAQSLTGKEVADETLKIGKSVVKTALIWTLASMLGGAMKDGINKVFKSKSS